jgi:hypothetical protein
VLRQALIDKGDGAVDDGLRSSREWSKQVKYNGTPQYGSIQRHDAPS